MVVLTRYVPLSASEGSRRGRVEVYLPVCRITWTGSVRRVSNESRAYFAPIRQSLPLLPGEVMGDTAYKDLRGLSQGLGQGGVRMDAEAHVLCNGSHFHSQHAF